MFIREVKTENGWVRGIQAADPRITAYKGIPFAAPPTGENRWCAPQPCRNWEGVKECYDFKPISMQDVPKLDDANVYTREWSVDPDLEMSEDCLYLNVWAPADPSKKNLPVFVWYFGGGLQVGHPSEMEFDGERIARRDVIVVSVNYRLNVFGFMAHPDLTANQPDAPANFGHLDQQFGTQWVKRNIAAFGGDPDNITIGGQSAGGASVLAQVTSPQNMGLFRRSIIESGMFLYAYPSSMHFGDTPSLAQGEQQGKNFLESIGIFSIEEARKLPAKELLEKAVAHGDFWGTVQDGQFCVGNPNDLFMKNRRVPGEVLWGRTSSEFYISPEVKDKEELLALAKSYFGSESECFLKQFDIESDSFDEIKKKLSVPSIDFAIQTVSECSRKYGDRADLYYYSFDAEIPGWDHMGTFHSVDLWFFFETLAKCWRPFKGKHYDLARQMCNYWANFIRSGNPNGKDADGTEMPRWEAWDKETPNCMVFGDAPILQTDSHTELMDLLIRNFIKNRKALQE